MSWGTWLAAAALTVGAGAFLDEYYVGDAVRDATRRRVAAWLQTLNSPKSKFEELVRKLKEASILTALSVLPLAFYAITYAIWKLGAHVLAGVLFILVFLTLLVYSVFFIPLIFVCLLALLSVFTTLSFKFVELLIWLVFKPAADPKRSPFKFTTGMAGLWILAAKLGVELTK